MLSVLWAGFLLSQEPRFLTVDLKEYNRADLYEAYREEELKSWIQENIMKEQEGTLLRKYEKFGVFAPEYLRRELEVKPDYLSFQAFRGRKIRGRKKLLMSRGPIAHAKLAARSE